MAQQIKYSAALDTIDPNSQTHIVGVVKKRLILLKTGKDKNPELIAWTEKDNVVARNRISIPAISPFALLSCFSNQQNAVIISQY